jgi:uncharacterized protein YegJ (DUF2314 family)
MTWTLANAEARAAQYGSFKIPPRDVREKLSVGELAKLIFRDTKAGERMWVEIYHVEPDAPVRYRGRLRNEPVSIAGLEKGAEIDFGPEHIADCGWSVE